MSLGDQAKKGEISVFDVVLIGEPEEKKAALEKGETRKFIKKIHNLKTHDNLIVIKKTQQVVMGFYQKAALFAIFLSVKFHNFLQ